MIKFVCLLAKRLFEIFHPFSFMCNSFYRVGWGGERESTCFSKNKRHRKASHEWASHEWGPGLLISFHALATATV